MKSANEKMYMHEHSGDVATLSDWRDDYEKMDIESWFGHIAEECEGLDWVKGGCLFEVEKDEDGEWVKVKNY